MKRAALFIILLLCLSHSATAATRTISVVGGNFNSTSTWDEGVVPVAGDAVVARGTGDSGNLIVNVASASASAIFTNYAATLTYNAAWTVTSTVTYVAGMTITGTTGGLICNGAATLTSAGKTMPAPLTLDGTVTYTLADSWTVSALVTVGNVGNTTTINGNQINANGGLTLGPATGTTVKGTTIFVMGAGTLTSAITSGSIQSPLTLVGGAGTITFSGSFVMSGNTLTYTSGTIASGSAAWIFGGTPVITANAAGLSFFSSSYTGSATWNGTSGFNITTFSALIAGTTITPGATLTYNIVNMTMTATAASHSKFVSGTGSSDVILNYTGSTLALAYVDATDINSSGGNPIYTYQGTFTRDHTNWTSGTVIGSGSGGGGGNVIGGDKAFSLLLIETMPSAWLRTIEWSRKEAREWIPRVWAVTASNQLVLEELRTDCELISDPKSSVSVPLLGDEPGGHDRFGRPLSPCLLRKLESGVALCCK